MICTGALTISTAAWARVLEPSAGETRPLQSPRGGTPVPEPAEPAPVASPPAEPKLPAPEGPAAAAPGDPAATGPVDTAAAPTGDTISPDMLDAGTPATATATSVPTTPRKPVAVSEDDELSPNQAITHAYAPKFRPKTNPGKLNIAARLMFANAGGGDSSGGRLGGLAADVGQSWNRFGYAITGTVWAGRYVAAPEGNTELNALIGLGPTIGLGRMSLLGRGFLDLRAGYDFYYGVVNRRGDGATVKPQGDAGVALSPARNLSPHGPRLRLDLGLLTLNESRRFFHGIGMSMGYQALVGSFNGQLPVTHMLTIGLAYWMG
jgi:hypothetical protein